MPSGTESVLPKAALMFELCDTLWIDRSSGLLPSGCKRWYFSRTARLLVLYLFFNAACEDGGGVSVDGNVDVGEDGDDLLICVGCGWRRLGLFTA